MLKNWLIAKHSSSPHCRYPAQLLSRKSQRKGITAAEIFTSICFAPLTFASACVCVCVCASECVYVCVCLRGCEFLTLRTEAIFRRNPIATAPQKPPGTFAWAICHRNSSACLLLLLLLMLLQRFENTLIYQYVSCCITINVASTPPPTVFLSKARMDTVGVTIRVLAVKAFNFSIQPSKTL